MNNYYIRPEQNPMVNPKANPNINPKANPNINPKANPNINPNVNPNVNPNWTPDDFNNNNYEREDYNMNNNYTYEEITISRREKNLKLIFGLLGIFLGLFWGVIGMFVGNNTELLTDYDYQSWKAWNTVCKIETSLVIIGAIVAVVLGIYFKVAVTNYVDEVEETVSSYTYVAENYDYEGYNNPYVDYEF